jgi:hypothetical protein
MQEEAIKNLAEQKAEGLSEAQGWKSLSWKLPEAGARPAQ